MSAQPDERQFVFDRSGRPQDDVSVGLVAPAGGEMRNVSGQTFESDELPDAQSGLDHLASQFVRTMEKRLWSTSGAAPGGCGADRRRDLEPP